MIDYPPIHDARFGRLTFDKHMNDADQIFHQFHDMYNHYAGIQTSVEHDLQYALPMDTDSHAHYVFSSSYLAYYLDVYQTTNDVD